MFSAFFVASVIAKNDDFSSIFMLSGKHPLKIEVGFTGGGRFIGNSPLD
jgi:hypothetical protein